MDLSAFGIDVPESYRKMREAGLLSYGESREDWRTNMASILAERPPALMGLDLEWMTEESVLQSAAKYAGRSSWRREWPDGFVFVAFAHTGAGDEWGWAPALARAEGDEPPVVFVEHDSDESLIVTSTFAGFVFRKATEAFAHFLMDDGDTTEKAAALLRTSTRRLLPFLSKKQQGLLEDLCERNVTEVTERVLKDSKKGFQEVGRSVHLAVAPQAWLERKASEALGKDARLDERLDEASLPALAAAHQQQRKR
jgi:hypothetical protein